MPIKIQNNQQLTFVVQGPTHLEWTPRCIASIKKYFPESPVVFCTHVPAGQTCGADQTLIIPDPGESKNNLRRQIATSKAGLNLVKTEFACKIRSDVEFVHGNLINVYNEHLPLVSSSLAFIQPVGILDVFTYHPYTLPLFLSDFIYVGMTSDIQSIFQCPLPTHDMENIVAECNPNELAGKQIGPEQYLAWYGSHTKFKHAKRVEDEEKSKALYALKHNYIVLDMGRQAGLIWHKNPFVERMAERDCLHNEGWKNL